MSLSSKENFYIVTALTPAQVQAKLDETVGAHKYQFAGVAVDGVFKLYLINGVNKTFGPEIEGNVEPYGDGSRVQISLRMSKKATLFLQIFIGLMVVSVIAMVIDLFVSKRGHHTFSPWFVIFLCYMPLINNYQSESKKTKAALLDILEGEEQPF